MVEQDSAGRIKIDIFPSMQLGGTPPQLYDQARDGVVDIVWTLPGSTAGRFPSTEVFELPFVGARRGIVNARASQEYADANLAKETSDIKLLSYWSHDHGLIHATKPVQTMEDLKGLKLRSPTRLAGEALKALGATAIPMPIPQVPDSVQLTRTYGPRDINAREASVLLKIASILREDYLIPDVEPVLADISHNVTVFPTKVGDQLKIYIARSSPFLPPLLEFYDRAYELFTQFMKDFVRVQIYPRIQEFVPSSMQDGVEALRKILERNRERFSLARVR
jgi:hypothetical protein